MDQRQFAKDKEPIECSCVNCTQQKCSELLQPVLNQAANTMDGNVLYRSRLHSITVGLTLTTLLVWSEAGRSRLLRAETLQCVQSQSPTLATWAHAIGGGREDVGEWHIITPPPSWGERSLKLTVVKEQRRRIASQKTWRHISSLYLSHRLYSPVFEWEQKVLVMSAQYVPVWGHFLQQKSVLVH